MGLKKAETAQTALPIPAPAKKTRRKVPEKILAQRGGSAFRNAALRPCRTCRRMVLYGLDADVCALSVTADPAPITALGETVALLAGRATYHLAAAAGRRQLHYRDAWAIEGERKSPVVAEHRCGQVLDAFASDEQIPAAAKKAAPSDSPPF